MRACVHVCVPLGRLLVWDGYRRKDVSNPSNLADVPCPPLLSSPSPQELEQEEANETERLEVELQAEQAQWVAGLDAQQKPRAVGAVEEARGQR